jgi:hypothetical protein
MAFGQKVTSVKNLKQGLKSKGGLITWIPKEASLNVRFLTEPDGWCKYTEIWSEVSNAGYPMPEEGQPGYPDPEQRKNVRYLANAVDVDANRGIVLQMPKSLVNQLVVRYDKYETITDRDYELFKTGSGLDTDYGLSPEPASKRKVDQYPIQDLEEVLQKTYDSVWGDSDAGEDEGPPARPAKAAVPSKSAPAKSAPAKKVAGVKKAGAKKPETPEALALLADDGDVAAATKLSQMAEAVDVDAEAFATWAEVADAIAAESDAAPAEVADADYWEVLGADADDGDADAISALTSQADTFGLPGDYGTWTELAQALAETVTGAPGGSDSPDADPGDGIPDDDVMEDMALGDLRALARENDIVARGLSKAQLIAALQEARMPF